MYTFFLNVNNYNGKPEFYIFALKLTMTSNRDHIYCWWIVMHSTDHNLKFIGKKIPKAIKAEKKKRLLKKITNQNSIWNEQIDRKKKKEILADREIFYAKEELVIVF